MSGVNNHCSHCHLDNHDITQTEFQCFPGSPNQVTFRGKVQDRTQATAREVIYYMERWISSSDAVTMPVHHARLDINSTCVVLIISLDDPECPGYLTSTASTVHTITTSNSVYNTSMLMTTHQTQDYQSDNLSEFPDYITATPVSTVTTSNYNDVYSSSVLMTTHQTQDDEKRNSSSSDHECSGCLTASPVPTVIISNDVYSTSVLMATHQTHGNGKRSSNLSECPGYLTTTPVHTVTTSSVVYSTSTGITQQNLMINDHDYGSRSSHIAGSLSLFITTESQPGQGHTDTVIIVGGAVASVFIITVGVIVILCLSLMYRHKHTAK